MEGIAVNSRKYGEHGRIRLEVDTTQDGMCAWTRDFQDAKEILSLLLAIAPADTTKVRDFITRTVDFGEGNAVIRCEEKDFAKYGFEKSPPA